MNFYEDELDNENEQKEEQIIFMCSRCGFMYNLSNPPKNYLPFNYYVSNSDPSMIKCPRCGKKVKFETVSEEKYKEYVKKQEKKKQEDEAKKQEKKRQRTISVIKDEISGLAKDLKDKLFSNKITSKRFVAIFVYASRNIVRKYNNVVNIDWIDFRKNIYEISDGILELYKEQEKTEDIIQEYQDDIEQDEVYKEEISKFLELEHDIEDIDEVEEKENELEKINKDINKKEYKKEIEEKYQKRKNESLQKREEKEKSKKLQDLL